MKSIIILTASTGAGHNQAAANLKRQFEERGIYCHIVDMFKSTSKGLDTIVSDGYRFLAEKLPSAYGMIYKSTDNKSLNKFIFKNIFLTTEYRLKWIFKEFKPDLIISTHPFGAPMIGKLKKKKRIDVPFVQIVTDFKAHYTYIHKEVDAYIAASEYTVDSLIEKGIPKSRIYAYGIPLKEEFMHSKPRDFSQDKPFQLLIMGGSMGLPAMESAIKAVVNDNQTLKISIVCGKNKHLLEKLNREYEAEIKTGRITAYGFVNNVHELMDASDLIISKPGGLTTTEAIHKCIPMIIPFAIPGQERENTNFLVENDMAVEVKSIEMLSSHIKNLIEDRAYYKKMVNNMLNLSKTYSVSEIINLCMTLIDENNDEHLTK